MSCVCKRAAAVQASLPFLFRLTAKCHHGLPGPYVPCAYRQDDDGPARVLGRLFLLMLQDRDLRRWPIAKTASGAVSLSSTDMSFRVLPWQVERFPKEQWGDLSTRTASNPWSEPKMRGFGPLGNRLRRVAGCTLQACDSKAEPSADFHLTAFFSWPWKDAEISDWTDWSQCSTTCGPANQESEAEMYRLP